jgi:hypothetical protein
VKLSPCAGMQSISDRRRNYSIEPREKTTDHDDLNLDEGYDLFSVT